MKLKSGRHAALSALERIRRYGEFSDRAISVAAAELDGRERAFCAQLVYGTMQNLYLLDFYISSFLSGPIKKIEPKVLDILRLSTYQLCFLDKIPASAAVNEGVSLCRNSGNKRAVALVNAVLRKLSANIDKLPKVPDKGTAQYLSTLYSHPLWLVECFLKDHDFDFVERLLAANNIDPGATIQINPLRTNIEELSSRFRAKGIHVEPSGFNNSLHAARISGITELPEYKDGLFYIQDQAAMTAVLCSGVQRDMKVLDSCAAPGGKSFATAIQMQNKGEILSCDVSERKLPEITSNAERLGLNIIETRQMDAANPAPELYESFDVVFADVPCSGLGVIRKKPEIRFKNPEALNFFPSKQKEILSGVSKCLKPGGALLYSTCTVLREENEGVISEFIGDNPDFYVEDEKTLWPHIDNMDGFFICRMKKKT